MMSSSVCPDFLHATTQDLTTDDDGAEETVPDSDLQSFFKAGSVGAERINGAQAAAASHDFDMPCTHGCPYVIDKLHDHVNWCVMASSVLH